MKEFPYLPTIMDLTWNSEWSKIRPTKTPPGMAVTGEVATRVAWASRQEEVHHDRARRAFTRVPQIRATIQDRAAFSSRGSADFPEEPRVILKKWRVVK